MFNESWYSMVVFYVENESVKKNISEDVQHIFDAKQLKLNLKKLLKYYFDNLVLIYP